MPLEPASGYTLQCPDSAAATGGAGEGPDAKAGDHATTAVGEPKGEPKGAKSAEHVAVGEGAHKNANDATLSCRW